MQDPSGFMAGLLNVSAPVSARTNCPKGHSRSTSTHGTRMPTSRPQMFHRLAGPTWHVRSPVSAFDVACPHCGYVDAVRWERPWLKCKATSICGGHAGGVGPVGEFSRSGAGLMADQAGREPALGRRPTIPTQSPTRLRLERRQT